MLGIQSLADRRSELCIEHCKQIVNDEFHSLHYKYSCRYSLSVACKAWHSAD